MTATGPDAVSFLHSQLTNDIQSLPENRACLAGYCSTKGRLLASLLIWRSQETVFLEVPAELQESFQKRLQIYVLRSKVKLSASNTDVIVGVLGEDAAAQLTTWFPTLPSAPYEVVSNTSGTLIRLTDANQVARYQWIVSKSLFEQLSLTTIPEHHWALSEIHAGIPHISLATQEKLVPQMINYELIGGVNFKKGCYPGQEIVARTHYLGKQKRRMVLAQIDHPHVQSGMEVFAGIDQTQPCGMIINAQPNTQGGSDCLIELQIAVLGDANVRLASGDLCRWLPMPYSM
jgi:tRNA-modifying protein YgfZ